MGLTKKENKYICLEEQSVAVFSFLYKGKRVQLMDVDKKMHQQTASSSGRGRGGGVLPYRSDGDVLLFT